LNVLFQGQQAEYDFKGGAGAASVVNQGAPRTRIQHAEPESPKTPSENELSDSEINLEDTKESGPSRHSTRTAGKSYKYQPLLYNVYISCVFSSYKVTRRIVALC